MTRTEHQEGEGSGARRLADVLPSAHSFELKTPIGQRLVHVRVPETAPPAAGFPLLTVLDAGDTFAIAAATMRMQERRPEVTGVVPAVLVGLGGGIGDDSGIERTRDYTPEVPPERLGQRPDGRPWPQTGGAEAFLDMLSALVIPRIASQYAVDPNRISLFGHSFGGLFALYALLTRPHLFRSIVASSPSIWFGERAILDRLREAPARAPELLVTVGGAEQSVDRAGIDPVRADWVRGNRMVDNARELVDALASRDWPATFHAFADENHASVLPSALSRALRFCLRP